MCFCIIVINPSSDNNINLESLLPFSNSFILRLNISGNPSLDAFPRDQILKKLHQVWVLNDDYVKTEETTTWGGVADENDHFLSGGWQLAQVLSDKQRDMFDVVMNAIPKKNQTADYFKLDYLLDDYSYQAFVHNSAAGTVLGENKPMPTVNCNDLLLMEHTDRLDLAVLLTARLFHRVPTVVFKDTMEKLLVSYMSLTAIHDLQALPTFAITAVICLIVRISHRELTELQQCSTLISKTNIPGLVRGKALFTANSPPSRDASGFRFLKCVRFFLSRDLNPAIPSVSQREGGPSQQPSVTFYSELEHEILKSLNDIPTRATFPARGTRAYQEWVPFIARHTLVMMTKVSSCPSLTRCQTSMASQHTYNQLEELLTAASMTYEDMNITTSGSTQDGRVGLTQSKSVLAFGAGLPSASCTALQWNRSEMARKYTKPWSKDHASSHQPSSDMNDVVQNDGEDDVESLLSHMSHDIADLSVEGGDDILESSGPKRRHEQRHTRSPRDKSPTIPFIRVSSAKENPYVLEDDNLNDGAVTPSSVQQEGRPWSMSLQTADRTKSLETLYLGMNDSSALVPELGVSQTDTGPVLSPLELPSPVRLSPLVMSPLRTSPIMLNTNIDHNNFPPKSPAIVSGFSAPNEPFNQFVLSSPQKMENWATTAGKEWKDIDLAPLLVHPLSKYPVYMKRRQHPSGTGPELEEDHHNEYDVLSADEKDWQLHVKEHKPNTFEVEDKAYAAYRHQIFQESQKHEEIQALADQMKQENMNQQDSSKLITKFIKSKDPNESKNELLREMGTTRNLRFQHEMATNLKREIMRQRREEEQRRHYSYRGIKLEGGSSIISQESYATLETKNSLLSDMKLGVDLKRVSWNTFVNRKPKLPTLETVCAMPLPAAESNTFLTEPGKDKSRPSSPSKSPLSYVPSPIPLRPDHVFREQSGVEEKGWDTNIPLTNHVRKALKYSSVYTNSAEVDWGVILTNGKAPAAWFPRPEKTTFTLAQHTPVNVARMEQRLQLSPREHPPPASSVIYPIHPKPLRTVQSPATSTNNIGNSTKVEGEAAPDPSTSGRPTSRQRSYRPDKSRKKVAGAPKRITAPAFTSNFTNFSLQERDPIFVEVTEIGDNASTSSCKHSSCVAEDSKSMFNGSVASTDIQEEYIRSLTISVTNAAGGDAVENKSTSALDNASLGSASLSIGSVQREKKAEILKRQQLEV